MSQINDAIQAVVGPQINDGLLVHYKANGATSDELQDAEFEFLVAGGAAEASIADMYHELLGPGHLSDLLLDFWIAGGTFGPPAAPIWTTDPPVVPKAIDGDAFTYDFEPDLNSGDGVVLTVTAGALPSGLAISGLTVTGTPDTAETQAGIQITATNAGGGTESLPFSMEVVVQSANFIDNSRWNNISGSVGGADFLAPTDWSLGFFPPDDAVAVQPGGTHPDAFACQFISIANRGYLSFDFDSSGHIGVEMNLSCFVDETAVATDSTVIQVSGNVDIIQDSPQLAMGFTGRIDMVVRPNGPSITIRVGAGVKNDMDGDFTLSRPQFTAGDTLRAYSQTAAPEGLGPELLADPTFNQDAAQWSLQAGWTISGNQGHAAANATATNGCQANNPAPLIVDATTYRVKITTLNGTYVNTGLLTELDGAPSQTIAMADGDHEIDILTTSAQTIFRFRINATGDFIGDFEVASCREIL